MRHPRRHLKVGSGGEPSTHRRESARAEFERTAYPFAPPEVVTLLTYQRLIIRKFLESDLGLPNRP